MKILPLDKIRLVPRHLWLLLIIICFGIFLRTYNFHDWLHFEYDQLRDVTLVGDVLGGKADWPLLGQTMRKSGDSENMLFHLGPIYYYFQILSAEIFGDNPVSMAYPDLFFSILSIPLLYVLFKRYFSVNISLILTGLYSISFFSIHYSRFAWNSNSIPFFTILFLLSLSEFLSNKEKTGWVWAAAAGVAIGVGIQLHVILFVLFFAIASLVFLYLLGCNCGIWKKLIAIFAIVIALNAGYLISEFKNNFANSKILFKSEQANNENFLEKLINDIDCHAEANLYMLSSYGNENCNFSYSDILKDKKAKTLKAKVKSTNFIALTFLQTLFSIIGYVFLIYYAWKEKDKNKKYFLRLIVLYAVLYFLIRLPIIGQNFDAFRYFSPTFFIPLVFLGFLIDFINKKLSKRYWIISFSIISVVIIANAQSLKYEFQRLQSGNKSDIYYHNGILGDLELITKYLRDNSENQKDVYISGDRFSLLPPLKYLAQRQNFNIIEFNYKNSDIPKGKAAFFVSDKLKDNADNNFADYKVKSYKVFGRIIIYKLEN